MDAVYCEFCLFASCTSHHQHLCMSARIQEPLAANSKQVTGHEFCTVWADKCLVRGGEEGDGHLVTPPPPQVKRDKSSRGSIDTTNTCSDPQRVGMCSGERPIGAAKGKQIKTMASCLSPPQGGGKPSSLWGGGDKGFWGGGAYLSGTAAPRQAPASPPPPSLHVL